MATNLNAAGVHSGRSRRRHARFDVTMLRWAVGVGGVVALLALAALPGPAPEVEGAREAPALAADPAASPVLDGRGKWTGYSSMAHEWREAPAVTPGGWSAPAQLAH